MLLPLAESYLDLSLRAEAGGRASNTECAVQGPESCHFSVRVHPAPAVLAAVFRVADNAFLGARGYRTGDLSMRTGLPSNTQIAVQRPEPGHLSREPDLTPAAPS